MGHPKSNWAILLSTVVTGKALDVYSRISDSDCQDYEKLKSALLTAYDMNAEGFRKKFRYSSPRVLKCMRNL